jgi:DtxR family Mn-dependent transcriptional regulator
MKKGQLLSESLEDYLETILELEKVQKVARAKDIAEKMGVRRGSVTGALKTLNEKGLINYEPYSFITLTAMGKRIAREINRRHVVLEDFLVRVLGVDKSQAAETACRMEHAIDKQSVDKIVKFIKFVDHCPRTGGDWVNAFEQFCEIKEPTEQECKVCMETCNDRLQNASN